MSGRVEIQQWAEDNGFIIPEDSLEVNYERISEAFTKEGRSKLDNILKDEKSEFEEWIQGQLIEPSSQLLEPSEPPQQEFIKIRAYSYIRKGKVINISSHQRRKRK